MINCIFIFILGACVGSFLNVVFYRVPISKSVIYSYSECTSCKRRIQFQDLIPILSWIFLGGKCRFCKSKISVIYPFVELITAISWLIITVINPYSTNGLESNIANIFNCFLVSIIIIIFYFDLNYLWIPKFSLDLLLFSGIIFLILKLLNGLISSNIFIFNLCSYFLFFIAFELIRKLGKYIYKKEVLGKGDSYIVASNALLIGLKGNLVALLISFVFASLFEISIRLFNKEIKTNQFALGPYLLFGLLIVWNFGFNPIWIIWQNFITKLLI